MLPEDRRGHGAALFVFTLLAAALRLPGLFSDFWLDEIWALTNVLPLRSPFQVLTAVHHDSNHYLIGLWMYALGSGKAFAWYRLPSFVAGVAAVPAAGALARVDREGRPVLAMFLVAISFPLGFYSSEARGYSLAALAALLALYCLVRFAEEGDPWFAWGYGLATVLGVLSHLSFLIVLVAGLLLGVVLVARGRLRARALVALEAAPAAALATLFAVDLRYLRFGGGPHEPPALLLARTASLSIGGPTEAPAVWGFAAIAAALVAVELFRRIRCFWPERSLDHPGAYLWVFYAAVLVLPVWLALVLDPPFLFPRYFLVSIAFVPLLLGSLAGSGSSLRVVLLLALVSGTSLWSYARFAAEGRGHYEMALLRILASSQGHPVTVGSDHDFRNEMIVNFYRERMGDTGARITYSKTGTGAPDFWIGSLEGSTCLGCRLLAVFPSSTLSGETWRLYEPPSSADGVEDERERD